MPSTVAIAALLASVHAAATPLRDPVETDSVNSWPNFADYTATSSAVVNSLALGLSQIAAVGGGTATELGGYQCLRSGLAYGFPQVVASDAAAANSAVQTFFAHDDGTLLGVGETNSNCCNVLASCASIDKATTGTIQTHRAVFTTAKENGATLFWTPAQMQWNTDFILMAAWQDTAKCTSSQETTLAGTAVDVVGTNIGSIYKCTYKLKVAADGGAPSFKVKESNFVAFNFQWMEFETSSLTNIVPATDATPWHFGATTGTWPFPIKYYDNAGSDDGKDSQVVLVDQPNTFDLKAYGVGEPGFLMSQTNEGSIWDGTATVDVSYGALVDMTTAYNTRVAAYNTALTAFNAAAATYNTAARAEAARKADATKAAFDAPIAIPTRPCPPTAVGAFEGPTLKLDQTAALTADEKSAGIVTWTEDFPQASMSVKSGFLQAATSDTATAADVNAGHVYGILGQATTWPAAWSLTDSEGAFQWKAPTGTHEMIVSVLPSGRSIPDDKSFTLTALNVQFKTDWSIAQTAVSAVPATALEAVGAKALAASVAAAVAVSASLF